LFSVGENRLAKPQVGDFLNELWSESSGGAKKRDTLYASYASSLS
jgi:hypothetical protein